MNVKEMLILLTLWARFAQDKFLRPDKRNIAEYISAESFPNWLFIFIMIKLMIVYFSWICKMWMNWKTYCLFWYDAMLHIDEKDLYAYCWCIWACALDWDKYTYTVLITMMKIGLLGNQICSNMFCTVM